MKQPKLIRTCSIWRALEVIGDTSVLLILESIWLGAHRFDEIRGRTGLLKALLSDRLKRLVAADVLEKRLYNKNPPRYEYVATQKGRDLYWTALMLLRWERNWGTKVGKIKIKLRHKTCGEIFEPVPLCGHCKEPALAREVTWKEGPGVGLMAPKYSRRRQHREVGSDEAEATSLMEDSAQLMGDRWAGLILRSIFTGLRRFEEIRKDTAIATNILSERLAWLLEKEIITQHQYSDVPVRYEYRLSEKGLDYYPALLMLLQWGDKYYVSPEGPPLLLTHKPCNKTLDAIVACSHCHEAILAQDVEFEIEESKGSAKKSA
ncbi:helix-turn-helix domain-containing protein [Hyphococcus formosus]|uniref:winged helix-turn-helix transcriptional regulator n=1 Tax=Hyphococcus formosus TaxID=3143534 RepID=UPI00398B1F77